MPKLAFYGVFLKVVVGRLKLHKDAYFENVRLVEARRPFWPTLAAPWTLITGSALIFASNRKGARETPQRARNGPEGVPESLPGKVLKIMVSETLVFYEVKR